MKPVYQSKGPKKGQCLLSFDLGAWCWITYSPLLIGPLQANTGLCQCTHNWFMQLKPFTYNEGVQMRRRRAELPPLLCLTVHYGMRTEQATCSTTHTHWISNALLMTHRTRDRSDVPWCLQCHCHSSYLSHESLRFINISHYSAGYRKNSECLHPLAQKG